MKKIKILSLKAKGFDEGSPQDPPVKSLSERGFCPPYDHCLLKPLFSIISSNQCSGEITFGNLRRKVC